MGGEPERGIYLTVACKFGAWFLFGINPAIKVFVLLFCLFFFFFLEKTSYWR